MVTGSGSCFVCSCGGCGEISDGGVALWLCLDVALFSQILWFLSSLAS